jgi:ribosomal protein S6--L-glutamate ligase
MKIGILSRNRHLYSTRRLIEACEENNHEVVIIDTVRAAIQLKLSPDLHKNNLHLPKLDGVIPRIGASVTKYGLQVVRHFEQLGVAMTASEQGILQSRDKLLSHRVLENAGIPIPHTIHVSHPNQLRPAVIAVGGLPVVLKRRQSTQGRGVMLVKQNDTLRYIRNAMLRQNPATPLLVQTYIPEAFGKDIRLIVVGDKIVAAMERTASEGDFRSNLHRGGTAKRVQPTPDMRDLALATAKALGIAVAGVDLIFSNNGYLVLEANSSPGLEGIEGTTGIDVAGAIINYLESQFQAKRPV